MFRAFRYIYLHILHIARLSYMFIHMISASWTWMTSISMASTGGQTSLLTRLTLRCRMPRHSRVVGRKFRQRSFLESWGNSSYWAFCCSPWIWPCLNQSIFLGAVGGWKLVMIESWMKLPSWMFDGNGNLKVNSWIIWSQEFILAELFHMIWSLLFSCLVLFVYYLFSLVATCLVRWCLPEAQTCAILLFV